MKEQNILRWIIPSIVVSLIGLATLQILLLRDTYRQKEEAFDRNVINALEHVTRSLEMQEAQTKFSTLIRESHGNKVFLSDQKDTVIETGGIDSASIRVSMTTGQIVNDSIHVEHGIISFKREIPPDNIQTNNGMEKKQVLKDGKGLFIKQVITSGPRVKNDHDTMMMYVTANGTTTRVFNQDSLRDTQRKELVASMFDVFNITEGGEVEYRVTPECIDSLLRKYFIESSITLPYLYGIMEGKDASFPFVSDPVQAVKLHNSPYVASLFPAQFLLTNSKLVVYFPGKEIFLLKTIAPSLAATLLFISVILGSFIYTIGTINRQKRFSALLAEFINNITHEFKTPISTISVITDTLKNQEVAEQPDKVQRYNTIIRDEIGRLKTHVDKILQLAVLEEGDYEFKMAQLDTHDSIREAIERFTLKVEERGGTIASQLDASNRMIEADPYHFLNLIMNLLDNAEKYSPEKPSITVITGNEGNNFWLRVEDKGIGIGKEDQQHIFEKYYRVSTGDRHETKGFGLGLSYVKLTVAAHKGTVAISSTPGSGTSITISLPTIQS